MNFRFRCAICTISHKTRQTTTFIYKYFVCFSFTVPIPTLPPPPRDFPRPDIIVNCLADGVSVSVKVADPNFHGVMYVKGHAQSTECRRNVEQGEAAEPLDFSVKFDTCGLFHSDVSYLLAHIAIQTLQCYQFNSLLVLLSFDSPDCIFTAQCTEVRFASFFSG